MSDETTAPDSDVEAHGFGTLEDALESGTLESGTLEAHDDEEPDVEAHGFGTLEGGALESGTLENALE